MDSNGGGGLQPPNSPLDPPLVRMPLLSGTDIIFLVRPRPNYIISMLLKHSFNTTGKNSIQNSRGDEPPGKFQGARVPPPPRDRRPCAYPPPHPPTPAEYRPIPSDVTMLFNAGGPLSGISYRLHRSLVISTTLVILKQLLI